MRFLCVLLSLWATAVLAEEALQPAPSATTKTAEMPRVVMAKVGSREITVEEFMQFLAKNPSRVHEATTPEGKADLLRTAIETELLVNAMREEGLLPEEPSQTDLHQAFYKLEGKHFPTPPVPAEDELRAYYEANRSDFGIPASVRLTQIQFRIPDTASEEERAAARKRAEQALQRIASGEAFADVAGELTENPKAKETKGDVGFVWRHGNEWLEKALKGIKVGEHTGVLESPVGYDILLLTDEREAIITPFEEARDSVAKTLQTKLHKEARAAYVKQLADRVGVEIVIEDMKDSFPNGVFP